MSCNVIEFNKVYKKFSKANASHYSLREDILALLKKRPSKVDLNKNEFWALYDVSFSVQQGQIVHLSGPNGAGKSTAFRLISGLSDPTSGQVKVQGRIASIIELGTGFHPDLTGYENIFVNGVILGMRISEIKQRIDSIIDFSEVGEFIQMPIKHYSSGMHVRLAFAIAIHSEADIFLFDEVIAVGDQAFQHKCIDKIKELKNQNRTIMFVSHDALITQQLSADTLNLNRGRIV